MLQGAHEGGLARFGVAEDHATGRVGADVDGGDHLLEVLAHRTEALASDRHRRAHERIVLELGLLDGVQVADRRVERLQHILRHVELLEVAQL